MKSHIPVRVQNNKCYNQGYNCIGKKKVALLRPNKRCNVLLHYVLYIPSQCCSTFDIHPHDIVHYMCYQLVDHSEELFSHLGTLNVSGILNDLSHSQAFSMSQAL